MKRLALLLIIGIALGNWGDVSLAQAPSPTTAWSPSQPRRVTISRDGSVLMTLDVRTGSRLVASYDRQSATILGPARWELHGDVTLWTGPYELEPGRSETGGVITEAWMRSAPVVMTVKAADVSVEINVSGH